MFTLLTLGMVSPKFQQYLQSVLGVVGKEAVFECQIRGEPAPVITWLVLLETSAFNRLKNCVRLIADINRLIVD